MYLTTCDQPFAFQCSSPLDVKKVCEHRKHCLDYLIPVDDDDDGELIIGPPGRVFRSGFPEYARNVGDYTSREYPQRDFAAERFRDYWALPVYHHPTQDLPSGVLEIVASSYVFSNVLPEVNLTTTRVSVAEVNSGEYLKYFISPSILHNLGWSFRLFILILLSQTCTGHQEEEIAIIHIVSIVVSTIHKLPHREIWSASGEMLSSCDGDFIQKGQGVVGKAFSSKSACFCRDIRQLSITEYPLVPIARRLKYSACFAVCLQSYCSNNCIYVLEFFLPTTLLNSLMETLKERLGSSFKIASGQELGQKLTVEVIKVSPEDKFDSFEICNTTSSESTPGLVEEVSIAHDEPIVEDPLRDGASIEQRDNEVTNLEVQKPSWTLKSDLGITREVLEQNSTRRLEDAAKNIGVSRSTLKRICREYGINRWPPRKARKVSQAFAVQKTVQPSTEDTHEHHQSNATRLEDDNGMWVKAKYQGRMIKFRLPFSASKINLEENVAQRLNLAMGSFIIEYQDEDDDRIWITCDGDLRTSMSTLSSLGRTTIKMYIVKDRPNRRDQ
ncbi:unnamed protein product [Coffea canephora]|uniref:DH200=94 genomic scaffold, scaffold_1874 n=1 Tax=Coffea canephora TaxID=49390 RepID=A0A068VJG2_COFCA|nr:unnamed protein product [Coffea canephora]